jgi:hypothetical protein
MMIKVSNEFLDFNELIEVEKQIKLFEDISTTDGDFSYAFDIPKTLKNTRLLQNPFPDNINKPVYQQIPAQLLGDSGAELYDGYIRVEKVTSVYSCSFFAGNNNWFAQITGLLSDLDLSAYDVAQTEAEITYSWTRTEGIVFPLVDHGGLLTRSYPQVKVEDLIGGFYIKTIFNKVFAEAGIKLQGELLNDWRYLNTVCLKNSKNQSEIDARSTYAFTSGSARPNDDVDYKMTFTDDSTYPYSDGDNNNFDLANSRYVADLKMIVKVEGNFTSEDFPAINEGNILKIFVNGVEFAANPSTFPGSGDILTITKFVPLEVGDVLEIYSRYSTAAGANNILSGTVKITPSFIYKTFGVSAVPNWTKQQFVSNILRIFNVLASYNEGDATLTLNLFESIKAKTPIDLSPYISDVEVDYSEFIADYGKRTKLSYKEVEYEELREYNVGKFFKYGQGVIDVNNDFIQNDSDVITSDFANPIAYINGRLDMSIEKTNLLELDEGENLDATGVTDSSGVARFAIPEDLFLVGDLVRITDSTNAAYNGDWVVSAISTGWVEFLGIPYDTNSTATLTKLDYSYGNSDEVFLMINIPNYPVASFSGGSSIYLEANAETSWAVAYFDLINTARQINRDFIYSLSFGGIDDPLHYQTTMIDSYFRLFSRVLNDPVKLFCTCTIPYALFVQLDFLSPITIKTIETTNQYYLNRISGYKESYYPTTLELIKI